MPADYVDTRHWLPLTYTRCVIASLQTSNLLALTHEERSWTFYGFPLITQRLLALVYKPVCITKYFSLDLFNLFSLTRSHCPLSSWQQSSSSTAYHGSLCPLIEWRLASTTLCWPCPFDPLYHQLSGRHFILPLSGSPLCRDFEASPNPFRASHNKYQVNVSPWFVQF